MVCLPTFTIYFTIKNNQMKVNIPYMNAMGKGLFASTKFPRKLFLVVFVDFINLDSPFFSNGSWRHDYPLLRCPRNLVNG